MEGREEVEEETLYGNSLSSDSSIGVHLVSYPISKIITN